jgi:hypothetical protein
MNSRKTVSETIVTFSTAAENSMQELIGSGWKATYRRVRV